MFRKKLDQLGRIVVPKDLRKKLNIEIGDELDISVNGSNIVISKHYDSQLDAVIGSVDLLKDKELRHKLMNTIFTHKRSDAGV